jgi:hypothetical protein
VVAVLVREAVLLAVRVGRAAAAREMQILVQGFRELLTQVAGAEAVLETRLLMVATVVQA